MSERGVLLAGRLLQLCIDDGPNFIQLERPIVMLAIDKHRGRTLDSRAVAVVTVASHYGSNVGGIEMRRDAWENLPCR